MNTDNSIKGKIPALIEAFDDPRSKQHIVAVAGIVFAGLVLRLYAMWMGQCFHYFSVDDEISAFKVALAFLAGEDKAQYIGQPIFSGGHVPGPAWTLFWVMLYKLGGNTVSGACLVMTLINTGVILLVHRLALQFLRPSYALLATFLFATSPWPVYYAFGVWNPIPMTLWGALLFLTLWSVTQRNQSRQIFWVCLLAALMPQFHMISVFYIPVILWLLYLTPVTLNRKWFALGVVAGVALYLPYIVGEIATHWQNTREIFSESLPRSFGVFKIISTPINVLSNHPGRWTGHTFEAFRQYADLYFGSFIVLVVLNLISIVLSLMFFFRLVMDFFKSWQGRWLPGKPAFAEAPVAQFLGLFLIVPSLLFMVTGHNYGSRYAIVAFPLLFLLPALYVQRLQAGKKKTIIGRSLALMVVVNFYLVFSFFHYQHQRLTTGDVFLASFHNMESVWQQLRRDAGPDHKIKIEVADYLTQVGKKYDLNGIALANYIEAKEKYTRLSDKEGAPIVYVARQASAGAADTGPVVYNDHGLILERVNE